MNEHEPGFDPTLPTEQDLERQWSDNELKGKEPAFVAAIVYDRMRREGQHPNETTIAIRVADILERDSVDPKIALDAMKWRDETIVG